MRISVSKGADPGAAAPSAQGVEGEKTGKSSENKLNVVTCPFCRSLSGQQLDEQGVADEQVNSSAFVCMQEGVRGGFGQGSSMRCQHRAGRESPAEQQSTVGRWALPGAHQFLGTWLCSLSQVLTSFWLVAVEIWYSGHHEDCVCSCCRADVRYRR